MATYDVTLDSQGYMIDKLSYRKGVSSPFAPKQRFGDPGYGDLTRFSAWAVTDWRGGLGYSTFDPNHPDRFDSGAGMDVRNGDMRLGAAFTRVYNPGSGTTTDIYAFCVYLGVLYACSASSGKIFSSTNGFTWSVARSPAGYNGIKSMAVYNGYLFFGSSDDGKVGRFDGTTWTDTWITISGTPTGIRSMAVWGVAGSGQCLFCGCSKSGAAVLNRVDSGGAVTAIHTSQLDHIEAIANWGYSLVWAPMSDTAGYRGEVWSYDGAAVSLLATLDDNAVSSFCLFRNPLAPTPATSIPSTGTPTGRGGDNLFTITPTVIPGLVELESASRSRMMAASRTGGIIWTLTGSGLTELFRFPGSIGIGTNYAYFQPIRAMVMNNGRLCVPVNDSGGLGFYSYDGHGWSNPSSGGTATSARGIAAFNGAITVSGQAAAGGMIYQEDVVTPSSALLATGSFDAGLPATDKVLLSVTIQHSALASGESIRVEYDLEAANSYTTLGTNSTLGSRSATFSFASAVTAKKVRLRFRLAVSSTSASPALYAAILTYVIATDSKAEWTFDVLLEGTAEEPLILKDQVASSSTGAQLADALWATKAKKQTLAFTDLDGESKTVFLVDLEERVSERSQRLGLSTRARVKLGEV